MDSSPSIYVRLADETPAPPGIGGALITMVEPHRGRAREYNRWYEDDHFYAGAMTGPWFISGRRWVATRELKALRFGAAALLPTLGAGSYISVYLLDNGRVGEALEWGVHRMASTLLANGRGYPHRDHVFPAFSDFGFGVIRDPETPLRDQHALDRGYAGMTMQLLNPHGISREQTLESVQHACTSLIGSGSVAQCLCFLPRAYIPHPSMTVHGIPRQGELVCLLWFHETFPARDWDMFLEGRAMLEGAVHGKVEFSGAFIPTHPGTDDYVDDLW